jgi:hypothetical protein
MKLRRIAIVMSIGCVLIALSALANAPLAEIETLPNNAPEPGVLLVLGIALAMTAIVLRIRGKSNL